MAAWEGGGTQSFLSFIHQLAFWYAQNEGCLISGGSHRCYSVATFPSPVDAFTWVYKIKFHNLAFSNQMQKGANEQSSKKGKKNIIYKFKNSTELTQVIIYLVRKSSIPGHNNTPAIASGCHGCYMETFFPLLIYPFEGKRFAYFVRLLGVWSTYIQHHTA